MDAGPVSIEESLTLAPLHDRAAAFFIDAALFVCGYAATFWVLSPKDWPLNHEDGPVTAVWLGLFLAYQAASASLGGTLGCRALSLRLVDRDGRPLGLSRAVLRAVFLAVDVAAGLGALWALWEPLNRAWHDLATGSLVVRSPESRGAPWIGRLAGAAGGSLLLVYVWWANAVLPRYGRLVRFQSARAGLAEVSRLEQGFFRANGRYSADFEELLAFSGRPERLRKDFAVLFDPGYGVRVELLAQGYRLTAATAGPDKALITETSR